MLAKPERMEVQDLLVRSLRRLTPAQEVRLRALLARESPAAARMDREALLRFGQMTLGVWVLFHQAPKAA